jgi:hypothetical protein
MSSRGVPIFGISRCDCPIKPTDVTEVVYAPVVHTKAFLAAAVVAAVSIGLPSCSTAHALSDQQRKFVADVVQRGVNGDSMINSETQQTLGDVVCADLHKGNAAASEVIGVANHVTALHGSMPQAEVVVYWAITDLCTDEISQRQDHWRDGQ